MFDKILESYYRDVRKDEVSTIEVIKKLPVSYIFAMIIIIAGAIFSAIFSAYGNDVMTIVSMVVMICTYFWFAKKSKKDTRNSNKERAEDYKNDRLASWSRSLKKANYEKHTKTEGMIMFMEMLISCTDEEIASQKIWAEGFVSKNMLTFITSILVSYVAFLIGKITKVLTVGSLKGTLAIIIIALLFYFCILAIWSLSDERKKNKISVLYRMKKDMLYMKYLYKNEPGWDNNKPISVERTILVRARQVQEGEAKEDTGKLYEVDIISSTDK